MNKQMGQSVIKLIRWNRVFIVAAIGLAGFIITKQHLWIKTLGLMGQGLLSLAAFGILYIFILLPLMKIVKFFIRIPGEVSAQENESGETDFYSSREWRELRYIVLANNPRKCMLCGHDGQSLHVDHIRPRSLHPELALDIDNLQILCGDCNIGKSNKYEHDFRALT